VSATAEDRVSASNGSASDDQRAERAAGGKREVRWSSRRKEELVLRLLRGESLDALARECGQPAGRIAGWREDFLAAGREGLKARPAPPEERELREAQRKIGAQAIEIDTLQALLEKKGAPRSGRRSR
jgi:Helix-turn-helix domain